MLVFIIEDFPLILIVDEERQKNEKCLFKIRTINIAATLVAA